MPIPTISAAEVARRAAIGARFRARRIELELTMAEMAQRMGFTHQRLTQLESRGPSYIDQLFRMARALETHPALLLFGEDAEAWNEGLSVERNPDV